MLNFFWVGGKQHLATYILKKTIAHAQVHIFQKKC